MVVDVVVDVVVVADALMESCSDGAYFGNDGDD